MNYYAVICYMFITLCTSCDFSNNKIKFASTPNYQNIPCCNYYFSSINCNLDSIRNASLVGMLDTSTSPRPNLAVYHYQIDTIISNVNYKLTVDCTFPSSMDVSYFMKRHQSGFFERISNPFDSINDLIEMKFNYDVISKQEKQKLKMTYALIYKNPLHKGTYYGWSYYLPASNSDSLIEAYFNDIFVPEITKFEDDHNSDNWPE